MSLSLNIFLQFSLYSLWPLPLHAVNIVDHYWKLESPTPPLNDVLCALCESDHQKNLSHFST